MRFAHIRRTDGGVTSFGYQYDKDTGLVAYQRADCNPKDQFCKSIARKICEGRMGHSGPKGTFEVKDPSQIYSHFQDLLFLTTVTK